MTLFRSIIKPNLINGVRSYDPVFKTTMKEYGKSKSILFNFTTEHVYKDLLMTVDKPPRMHSYLIPKYKEIRKWQAEALLDVGEPVYKRYPVFRTIYRVLWYFTWVNFTIGLYKMWLVVRNANDGTPPPDFALYLP